MAEDKILVFNLRKAALKTPKTRRSGDVLSILRRRAAKFSKNGKVKIDERTNLAIWARGRKSPKLSLRLKIKKLDDGSVETELVS